MGHRWAKKSVAELQAAGALLVEDGNHGENRPRPDEFSTEGIQFIRAADMDSGRVLFESAQRINEVARQRVRKGIGAGGDVLLSHKGTVGKVAYVPLDAPPFVCSPQTTFWRVEDPEQLDRRFIYYYLLSRSFREQLDSRKGETDMADYVSLTTQRTLTVTVPPIAEQKAIAAVLGSLDDKIELNRRMNATLEALARALFTNWNEVHSQELVEYTVQKLIDGGTLLIGDGYRAKNTEMADVGLPFIRAGNLKSDGLDLHGAELLGTKSLANAGNKIGRAGDVAFTSKGTVGRITRVSSRTGAFVYSPQVCFWRSVAPEKLNPHVLYRWMGTDGFMSQVAAVCTQTDMAPYVSLKDQRRMLIRLPDSAAQREIAEHLEPIDDCIAANAEQARALAVLRDTLLPKLLSGGLKIRTGMPDPKVSVLPKNI